MHVCDACLSARVCHAPGGPEGLIEGHRLWAGRMGGRGLWRPFKQRCLEGTGKALSLGRGCVLAPVSGGTPSPSPRRGCASVTTHRWGRSLELPSLTLYPGAPRPFKDRGGGIQERVVCYPS